MQQRCKFETDPGLTLYLKPEWNNGSWCLPLDPKPIPTKIINILISIRWNGKPLRPGVGADDVSGRRSLMPSIYPRPGPFSLPIKSLFLSTTDTADADGIRCFESYLVNVKAIRCSFNRRDSWSKKRGEYNDNRALLVANVQFNLPVVTFYKYASICRLRFKTVLDVSVESCGATRRRLRVSCDPHSPLRALKINWKIYKTTS